MSEQILVLKVFETLLTHEIVVVEGVGTDASTLVAQEESVFGRGEVDDLVDKLVFGIEVRKIIKRRQTTQSILSMFSGIAQGGVRQMGMQGVGGSAQVEFVGLVVEAEMVVVVVVIVMVDVMGGRR